MATGESQGHLNCLLGRRRITFVRDRQGVGWYHQVAETAEAED